MNLEAALQELKKAALEFQTGAILTLAYEGGHPDHDCCAFLSHLVGSDSDLPVWEMPLYHRTSDGSKYQQFLEGSDEIYRLQITADELAKKRKMAEGYVSQAGVLDDFNLDLELFRPQLNYDFLRPPNSDAINYEMWEWAMKAEELCRAFASVRGRVAARLSGISGI